jgi:hypothetical protein
VESSCSSNNRFLALRSRKVAAASSHRKSELVHGVGWLSVVARWQRLRLVGKRNLHHVGLDLVKSWSLGFVDDANSLVRLQRQSSWLGC